MTEFKCIEGCQAPCCGPIAIPLDIFADNWDKRNKVREIEKRWAADGDVYLVTRDDKCIFLTEDFKCTIYDQRPQVCRQYGQTEDIPCPYVKTNGRPRSAAGVRATQRKINHFVDDTMRTLEKKFGRRQ